MFHDYLECFVLAFIFYRSLCKIIFQANETNFNCIEGADGTTPYFQEIEETTPYSDVEGSQTSSFHPNIYRVPSQTIDTASLTSAQTSVYGDAESGALVDFMSEYLILL